MSGKNINFDDKKNQKKYLLQNKRIYSTDGIDVNNILVSKKDHTQIKTHLNTL